MLAGHSRSKKEERISTTHVLVGTVLFGTLTLAHSHTEREENETEAAENIRHVQHVEPGGNGQGAPVQSLPGVLQ